MAKRVYPGARFGRLTVVCPTEKRQSSFIVYKCHCDCGNDCYIASGNIGKSTNSCGCLEEESRIKHNKSKTKLYDVWTNMRQRCLNPNNPRYKNYGGRGITICEEWNDFQNFYDWAIAHGYDENLNKEKKLCTLDREDVDGNYEPSNCRWITNKQQQNNKKDTILYEYNNKFYTISEWADILNLPLNVLKSRITRGWNIKRVLEQPINKRK